MASFYRRGASTRSYNMTKAAAPIQQKDPIPSVFQQAILDWIANDKGNAIVEAVAGSGKTSTLMMSYRLITRLYPSANVVFLSFGRSIADELKRRGIENANTFHALGYAAIRPILERINGKRWDFRGGMDANKVGNIFDNSYPDRDDLAVRSVVVRLVGLAKNSAILPADLDDETIIELIEHFDLSWDSDHSTKDVCDMVRNVLVTNNSITDLIDYDDMLYYVVVHNAKLTPYAWILVDESQDTNEIQRIILRRSMNANTRLIAVGDTRQAIYGFRGASHDAMQLIADDFHCKTLPLSISYRCPASVIRLAQNIVPHIQARDNAPEGTVLYPERFKRSDFLPSDLIVCRNSAPLVQVAYGMIAARIPCRIMGREIGKSLTALIKKLTGRNGTLETLADAIAKYQTVEMAKAFAQKKESKAQAVADKCESILALIDSMTPDDIAGGIPRLVSIIEEMFETKQKGAEEAPLGRMVTLATIHKAKGLEAPRVFILDYGLMPSKYAKQAWQIGQEHNLQYVAITRALDTLVFIDSRTITD